MRLSVVVVLAACALPPLRARAHFGPAEPPNFGTTECIVVVDKRTTPEVTFPYSVSFDDVEPEEGHIMLADSKRHQFFAFRGVVTPYLPDYDYRGFAATELRLPLWIATDDVQRADMANDPSIAPDFSGAAIGRDVLRERTDIAGQWLEVSTGPARVPITMEQAALGVRWNVTMVPPGIYQLVGYTFSPPFNAWEPRPGVIKIVDAASNVPAVTVDSIDGISYAGQGWRVTGCLDTPAGSTLSAWYRVEQEGQTGAEWRRWLTDTAVTSDAIDLCFGTEDAHLSGLIWLRIAVRGPDGSETFAYSPDALVRVNTPAACPSTEPRCCQPPGPATGAAGMGILQPSAAGSAVAPPPVGAVAGAPVPIAGAAAPPQPMPAANSGGCSTALGRIAPRGVDALWFGLGVVGWSVRRRQLRRRHGVGVALNSSTAPGCASTAVEPLVGPEVEPTSSVTT